MGESNTLIDGSLKHKLFYKGKLKSVYKFFTQTAKEIKKDEFIAIYNDIYYMDNHSNINGIVKNSLYIENEIDRLLKEEIKTEKDVIHILAWKIGKIKHGESEKNQRFEYASDWVNAEEGKVKRYGKEIDIKPFAQYIAKNIKDLSAIADKDPQKVMNQLKEQSPNGIGTVYLITLLYFISKGKYPIYDRFAMIALNAIEDNKEPGECVSYEELPEKNSKQFENIISFYQTNYVDKLEKIFGKKYQTDRDIDRALWVYGHLFQKQKEIKKKVCTL